MNNWVYELAFCVTVFLTGTVMDLLVGYPVSLWAWLVLGIGMGVVSLVGRSQGRAYPRSTDAEVDDDA